MGIRRACVYPGRLDCHANVESKNISGKIVKNIKKSVITLSVLVAALAMGTQAHSGTITGGIGLLTMTGGAQLETWLGEGSLALTSVFTHQAGDGKNSFDFHAAADGKGRTFSIMEVLSVNGVATHEIIGGYNPQSWSSIGDWHLTPNSADRTAAIFNLTDLVWRPQDTVNDSGMYQTFNDGRFGPAFGGGFDIGVGSDLSSGQVYPYSYGVQGGVNILGEMGFGGFEAVEYGRMEVFTIAADSASSVPDGGNMAMMIGGGLVCLVAVGRHKPARTVVPLP